jgi:hypothetical protein
VATRATSLAAYNALQASGALSSIRWAVYDCLFRNGPMTRNELDVALKGPATVNPSYSRRLTELEAMGVAARFGTRTCAITGRDCDAWDVTSASSVVAAAAREPSWREKAEALASAMATLEAYLRDEGLTIEADFLKKKREETLCASGP